MKTRYCFILSICFSILSAQRSHPYYGGGHHTSSHGGHYSGGSGSSHAGGHYKNSRTNNTYGRHRK